MSTKVHFQADSTRLVTAACYTYGTTTQDIAEVTCKRCLKMIETGSALTGMAR
jgi:hypothetical protein